MAEAGEEREAAAPEHPLHLVVLRYDDRPVTLAQAVDIPGAVGGTTAYVGFTGGTGGTVSTQKILTWTYLAQ